MATFSNLNWEFYRAVPDAAGISGIAHYDSGESQSLFLDSGIATRTQNIDRGNWQTSPQSNSIRLTSDDYSANAWDAPSNASLHGSADLGVNLYYLRYIHSMDISRYVKSGDWKSRNDSQVQQFSLALKNAGESVFLSDSSLFHPGARVTFAATTGDSSQYPIGEGYIDDISFDPQSSTVPISGRNSVGYKLTGQTFDDDNSFIGTAAETAEWIFSRAGITKYVVQYSGLLDMHTWGWVFDPDTTLYDGLKQLFAFYVGWDMVELPDGRIIVGYPDFIQQYQANSAYIFEAGKDLTKRKTTKNSDSAFSGVRVTGLDADRNDLVPVFVPVETYPDWYIGNNKTKHVKAPDGFTQEQLLEFANAQAATLAHIGVSESFSGPFRPWVIVGDVASIKKGDNDSVDLGLITDVTHRFGESGFFTDFSVDSGGVAETGDGYVTTRSAGNVYGYNRGQTITDYLRGSGDKAVKSSEGGGRASDSLFRLIMDSNSNLYVEYANAENIDPVFEYDSETGELYATTGQKLSFEYNGQTGAVYLIIGGGNV